MAPSENTEAYTTSLVTRGLGRLFCGGSIACLVIASLVFPKRKVVEFVKRRLFFLRLSHKPRISHDPNSRQRYKRTLGPYGLWHADIGRSISYSYLLQYLKGIFSSHYAGGLASAS